MTIDYRQRSQSDSCHDSKQFYYSSSCLLKMTNKKNHQNFKKALVKYFKSNQYSDANVFVP